MSRICKLIPRYVSIDMQGMALKIEEMTDEDLGAWFRKAVIDLCSGCIDSNTDAFIKEQYQRSHTKMAQRQEINNKYHQNQIAKKQTNEEEKNASNVTAIAPTEMKNAYGQNHHVMLTIEEGNKLRESYGPDLNLAIDILDSYIENNGKAAKKYKNHYAVLRRGNWVWNKVKETRLQEQRLENASHSNKSFKQQDLDARTEFFTHSIFDNGNTDEQN